ncbi:hypothetical protein LINPERHAP1_LOCUS27552 [Linum perenne]
MRIRVRMDIRNPIKRGKKVVKPNGEWSIAKFRYEKLPTFCYICGRMGHIDRHCEIFFRTPDEDIIRKWDKSQRAPPRKSQVLGGEQWLIEEEEEATPRPSGARGAMQVNLGASRWTKDENIQLLQDKSDDDTTLASHVGDDRKRPRKDNNNGMEIDNTTSKGIQAPLYLASAGLRSDGSCPPKC